MKNTLRFLMLMTAVISLSSLSAQTRYLDEVFTDAEITITNNVTFAANINFLTSNFTPSAQLLTDLGTLSFIADAGGVYPAAYYNAADASTQIKVTDIKMDVYRPSGTADTETARPVIIYLHTGNFLPPPISGSMMGTKSDSLAVDMCKAWARRGYVAVSMDYRLGWNPIAPDVQTRRGTLLNAVYRAIQDTKMGVRFLRADAAISNTYGIDPTKVALFGEGSGGYMSQAYTTLDNAQVELFLEKFRPNPFDLSTSYIDTLLVGLPSGLGYQNSVNLYRDVSIDASVQMSINAGGALADESWLEAGDVPMVAFHAIRDDFAPFTSGTVIVPTTQEEVVDVHGSNFFIQKANDIGNNAVFAGLPGGDVYTDRARSLYNTSWETSNGNTETVYASPEGLYSIVQPLRPFLTNISAPWQWWDPTAPLSLYEVAPGVTTHMVQIQSNPNMSEARSIAYQDTINGYMLPRLACVLDLPGNPCSAGSNDALCDAFPATVDGGVFTADNTGATADGEQGSCLFDAAVENDIWYFFTAPASGVVEIETFDTGGSDDTQIVVYSSSDGTCAGTLTEVGCNDDISGTDYMSFALVEGLTAGDTYFIQVDGWQGTQGSFDMEIRSIVLVVECPAPAAVICDNFDDYAVGSSIHDAAAWFGPWPPASTPSLVSDEQAFSNSNSLKVSDDNSEDNLLLFGNQTTGVWTVSWMMYIPTGNSAYFNVQNAETPGTWNLDAFFNAVNGSPGSGTIQQDAAAAITFPHDAWFPLTMTFNLNTNLLTMDVDGAAVLTAFAYAGNLGSINYYSNGAANTYYVDDLVFDGNPDVGLSEYTTGLFQISPNPTDGNFTVKGMENINSVVVRDILGATVAKIQTPMSQQVNIDLSGMESGMYFVEIQVGDVINVQRVIKQ
jgi:hypothetical protein